MADEPRPASTSEDRPARQRIALSRSYAVITPDQVVVKPARSALVGPAIQAGLTVLASLAIGVWIDSLPLWQAM